MLGAKVGALAVAALRQVGLELMDGWIRWVGGWGSFTAHRRDGAKPGWLMQTVQ